MPWIGVSLTVPGGEVEAITDVLNARGALAVTVRDAADVPIFEPQPGETPLWQHARVEALFDLDADLEGVRGVLQSWQPGGLAVHFVEDDDFSSTWRTHIEVACVGDRLWLAPRDARDGHVPGDGLPVLRLDPGLAFGTGTHPTTRLCLEWLTTVALDGERVLDYGCGSGILAIAALLLGAEYAAAVDYDDQALVATRDNAAYNGISEGRLSVGAPDMVDSQVFDVICANILAGALIELAPRLTELVRNQGRVVLSGILSEQVDDVAGAYPGFRFAPPLLRGEWAALAGVKVRG
jgi:ribosomal protein L11 methyltransferase